MRPRAPYAEEEWEVGYKGYAHTRARGVSWRWTGMHMHEDGVRGWYARIMAMGAVSGAMASHIQKPFLCLGVRLSSRECRCGMGEAQTEGGYTRGI